MPPDDDIFDNDAQANSDTDKGGADKGGPKLADQLATLATSVTKLSESQKQTNDRVSQLVQRWEDVAEAGDDADEGAEGTEAANDAQGRPLTPEQKRFAKFYADPEKFITEAAGKLLDERVAPHVRQTHARSARELEREQQQRIDSEFGEGTWEAEYSKDFEATIKKLPLAMQASEDHVLAGVAAIHGKKFLTPETRKGLEERRTKVEKAKEEAKKAPVMLGPGLSPVRRTGSDLSTEELDALDRLNRSGIKYTREQYAKARELGGSSSAWAAAAKAKREAEARANKGKQQ